MPARKLLSFASTLIGAIASGLFLALFSAPAAADLFGYCAGFHQCVVRGPNSGTDINPPEQFGFTTDFGVPVVGDLFIDVLVPDNRVPDNLVINPSSLSFVLTGTLSGTATLFNTSPWTSGQLDAYLGTPFMGAEPANPIEAFLPTVHNNGNPGATGFFVYQVDLGTTTLQSIQFPNVSPLEDIGSAWTNGQMPPGPTWANGRISAGSYIVGFLNDGGPRFQATANTGAIFLLEPASLLLLATGLLGLGVSRRRRGS